MLRSRSSRLALNEGPRLSDALCPLERLVGAQLAEEEAEVLRVQFMRPDTPVGEISLELGYLVDLIVREALAVEGLDPLVLHRVNRRGDCLHCLRALSPGLIRHRLCAFARKS